MALVSLLVYALNSEAVAFLLSQRDYFGELFTLLRRHPSSRVFTFPMVPAPGALWWTAVALVATVGTGVAVARALRGQAGATPMGWSAALVTAVVPPQLLATMAWPDGRGALDNATIAMGHVVVGAVLGASAWYAWGSRSRIRGGRGTRQGTAPANRGVHGADASDDGPSIWLIALLVVLCFYAVLMMAYGTAGILGFDSYSDHLARPARWLATGRIERGLPEEAVPFYPGNFELLVRWTVALGTDRLGFLVALASNITALWLIYRLARELGLRTEAAGMAAVSAASLQVLAYQSVVVYADGFMAMALLLATWLLLIWVRTGATDRRLALGFGAALGVALGTKYSALPPAAVLGGVYAWHARLDASDPVEPAPLVNWRWLGGHLLPVVVGVLPGVAYWYLRNLVEQHNPFFPMSVLGLPGIPVQELVSGALGPRSLGARLIYPWLETGYGFGYEMGLGPLVAAAVVPAALCTPFLPKPRPRVFATVWVVFAGAMLAWNYSGVMTPRFGLFPLLLGFVLVGALWEAVDSRLLRLVVRTGVVGTVLLVGHELAAGVAYLEVTWPDRPQVPAVFDSLPPTRIFNLGGEPAGYLAMGSRRQHDVEGRFRRTTPADLRRLAPPYVLLPGKREREFVDSLPLEPVARWRSGVKRLPYSLWRYRGGGTRMESASDSGTRTP